PRASQPHLHGRPPRCGDRRHPPGAGPRSPWRGSCAHYAVTRPIRIAVVGTGFGARIQAPGVRASGRFEVVALVGRELERAGDAARRAGVAGACASLDDVLGECDAVSIATPPATHAGLAIAAARAGKHVLCEKPMARSVAEAHAMCEAARAAAVVGMVDFEF